jgi:hypothetical protein
MASKRKLAQRARTLARRQSQSKPGGSSAYATKRRRVHAGWDNPRSPIRAEEARAASMVPPGSYTPEDLASRIFEAAEASL